MRLALRSPLLPLIAAAIPLLLAPGCGGDDGTSTATSGTGAGAGQGGAGQGGAGQGGAGQGGAGGGQGGGAACAPGETEFCYSGPAGTETTGLCRAGLQTCLADGSGYGPCEGEVTPQPESCATAGDDDCDGMANEEGADCLCVPGEVADCYTGGAGTQDVGACHGGTQVCNADGLSYGPCEGEVTPQAETCMTPVDDDCDGAINEGGVGCVCTPNTTEDCYSGAPGTEDVGNCVGGTRACNSQGTAWGPCVGEVTPMSESCVAPGDEDCDGVANEEGAGCLCVPGQAAGCYTGPQGTQNVGICHGGTQICNADGITYGPCQGEVTPQAETCMNLEDDDCDGAMNEEGAGCVCVPLTTVSCYSGAPGTAGVGVCTAGTSTCNVVGTGWEPCAGEVTPQAEICSTPADENCDGSVGPCVSFLWAQRFGDAAEQGVVDVVADAQGNIYLAGNFAGTIDLGGGPLTSGATTDLFVAKFSPAGVHLWSKRFGNVGGSDNLRSLSLDAAGNLLLTGSYVATIDLGGGLLSSAGSNDIFVAKLDSNGNHLWSKSFGSTGADDGTGIAADPLGNVLITGVFRNTITFGGPALTSAGGTDIFVVKLNASGDHVWSQSYGDAAAQSTRSIDVDSTGAAAVIGYFQGTVDIGGGPFTAVGSNDVLLFKLSAAGAHLWSKAFSGSGSNIGHRVVVDASNNVLASGYVQGALDFGAGPTPSGNGNDVFVAKYDAASAHLWSHRWSGLGDQLGYGLAVDGSGNVALAGRLEVSADLGGGTMTSAGLADVFAIKLDSMGTHLWGERFGDAVDQRGSAVGFDPSGNLLLAGQFQGSLDFGAGALLSAGGNDVFLAKFGP